MKIFERSEVDKQKKAEEWAAFKQMRFTKKIEHIFVYYRLVIFFTLAVVFGVGALLNTTVFNRPDPTFAHITIYGRYITPIQRRYIEIYLQRHIAEPMAETHQITMENLFIERGATGSLTGAQAQRFTAQLFVREIDLIIFCGQFFDQLNDRDIFMDLRHAFSENELAALAPRLLHGVYTAFDEYGRPHSEETPFAVRLNPGSMLVQLKDHGDSIYIGIVTNTRRQQPASVVMRGLFEAEEFRHY